VTIYNFIFLYAISFYSHKNDRTKLDSTTRVQTSTEADGTINTKISYRLTDRRLWSKTKNERLGPRLQL